MDQAKLVARAAELLEGGAGEPIPGSASERFLPLVTLESGARCGIDSKACWLIAPEDDKPAVRFSPATAHLFHEPLEWKRGRFDDAIEEGARAVGLPPDDTVLAYPSVEIIRAVIAKQASYLTRLALHWAHNTELRELRRDIVSVTKQDNMPVAVKELAARLIVPE